MRPRALLCDAAGTLFVPRRPVAESYAAVFVQHGLRVLPSAIAGVFQQVFENAPPMAFPKAPAAEIPSLERGWWRGIVEQVLSRASPRREPRDFEACFDALFAYFARPTSWRLLPGTTEVLGAFRARGVRLGIASNFDLRIHEILSGLGIAAHFQAVILPAQVRCTKPDPLFFRYALEQLDSTATETVFLGDDLERDLAGARAAGMQAVHAPSLATLSDLPNLIAGLAEVSPERSMK